MPKVNEKKLELYANKLYRGELYRYKKKIKSESIYNINVFFRDENKIIRKPVTKSQEKVVLDTYKSKCVVCKRDYDKDDFEIHHVDGNRSNTVTTNLIPLCHRCHKKVTTKAKAKLKDYINTHQKPQEVFPTFKPIKIKMPKSPRFKF